MQVCRLRHCSQHHHVTVVDIIPEKVEMINNRKSPIKDEYIVNYLSRLTKVYDHAKHTYKFDFRMLTCGWSDGSTFLPVNSVLLSSENKKNRLNEAKSVDKRTVGYKRRMLSMQKGTHAMLELLQAAKKAAIPKVRSF